MEVRKCALHYPIIVVLRGCNRNGTTPQFLQIGIGNWLVRSRSYGNTSTAVGIGIVGSGIASRIVVVVVVVVVVARLALVPFVDGWHQRLF